MPASGIAQPIEAKKLILKRSPSGRETLVFVTKDPTVPFPTTGSADDPSAGAGMLVELLSANEGTFSIFLPAGPAWTAKDAAVDLYRFKNKAAPAGPSEAKVSILKDQKLLKLIAKGFGGLPLGSGGQGSIGVRITVGALQSCALFSPGQSTIVKDEENKFLAKNALLGGLSDCSDSSLNPAMEPCPAGTVVVADGCWRYSALNASCDAAGASVGLVYDDYTRTYAGSVGTDSQCDAVWDALGPPPAVPFGIPGPVEPDSCTPFGGLGCVGSVAPVLGRFRCTDPSTNGSDSWLSAIRACACQ